MLTLQPATIVDNFSSTFYVNVTISQAVVLTDLTPGTSVGLILFRCGDAIRLFSRLSCLSRFVTLSSSFVIMSSNKRKLIMFI